MIANATYVFVICSLRGAFTPLSTALVSAEILSVALNISYDIRPKHKRHLDEFRLFGSTSNTINKDPANQREKPCVRGLGLYLTSLPRTHFAWAQCSFHWLCVPGLVTSSSRYHPSIDLTIREKRVMGQRTAIVQSLKPWRYRQCCNQRRVKGTDKRMWRVRMNTRRGHSRRIQEESATERVQMQSPRDNSTSPAQFSRHLIDPHVCERYRTVRRPSQGYETPFAAIPARQNARARTKWYESAWKGYIPHCSSCCMDRARCSLRMTK